jgi:medium-chain acyl-[acyl-carrier-protein] hydrolase
LVCFPFAGSNPHSFDHWVRTADPLTEVVTLSLPTDRKVSSLQAIAAGLLPELAPHLDRPCAFFGHDLGALLMHEVTLLLRDSGLRLPDRSFVSRSISPHLNFFPPVHVFADDKFAQLVRFFGLPVEDEQSLRRDFALIAGYRAVSARALPVPITAFAGRNDTLVPSAGVSGWREYTTAGFALHLDDAAHHVLQPEGPNALTCARLVELWPPAEVPEAL